MAKFLTTHTTASNIESIILDSKKKLILVSPYLQLSRIFFSRLRDADERGVKIVLVYGKDKLKSDEKKQLTSLKNLILYFCDNLHAKCYLNEQKMVITSMNMYEFSEKNNREMGVLINKQNDTDIFNNAVKEVQSIIKESLKENAPSHDATRHPVAASKANAKPFSTKNSKKSEAYCIRCGDGLSFDPTYPLCDECYDEWADYENPDYPERFCHSCGKKTKTTKNKPLCHSCFSKLYR